MSFNEDMCDLLTRKIPQQELETRAIELRRKYMLPIGIRLPNGKLHTIHPDDPRWREIDPEQLARHNIAHAPFPALRPPDVWKN